MDNVDSLLDDAERWLGMSRQMKRAPFEEGNLKGPNGFEQTSFTSTDILDFDQSAQQDNVMWLQSALNDKNTEVLELRSQYAQLLERSRQAQHNWESALQSKERAIRKLEEALALRPPHDLPCAVLTSGTEVFDLGDIWFAPMEPGKTMYARALGCQCSETLLPCASLAQGKGALPLQTILQTVEETAEKEKSDQEDLKRELDRLRTQVAGLEDALALAEQLQRGGEWHRSQGPVQKSLLTNAKSVPDSISTYAALRERLEARTLSAKKYKAAVRSLKVRLQEVSAAAAGNHAQVLHMRSLLADVLQSRQCSLAHQGSGALDALVLVGSLQHRIEALLTENQRLKCSLKGCKQELSRVQRQTTQYPEPSKEEQGHQTAHLDKA